MVRARITLLLLALPFIVCGKGGTIRIVIQSPSLSAPIEISDPALTHQFNIWSGPGTGPTARGETLNLDWSRGIAHPRRGLESYFVSFVAKDTGPSTYVVRYVVDPTNKQGYIYIPGKADQGYRDNVQMIYRGIEGNWFYASKTWQALADPLISSNGKLRRVAFHSPQQ